MNSKQVNFFIMPEDLLEIESFLVNEGVLFIPLPIYDEKNIYSPSLIRDPKPKIEYGQTYLTNKDYCSKVIIEKIEKQGYYLVEDSQSLAIQFCRGGFLYKPNQLERGRLYYVTGYYNKDRAFIRKEEQFIKWADKIFKEVKKRFLKKGESFEYYSPRATAWLSEPGIKKERSGLSIISPV